MEGNLSIINNHTDLVVDRINTLPGSILGHILSFLPTKEAVATSILSKSWKFVWLDVHNLDFYYKDSEVARNEAENMKFVRFVERVLLLTDAGSLNKFSLVWDASTISSHVSSWINTAITRNLRELYLSAGQIFNIPASSFNSDSLQSLELNENIYVSATDVVCLPRLENLKLDKVCFESEVVCEKLISGCPMLQSLYLDYDMDDEELHTPLSVFSCDSLQSLVLKGDIYVPAGIVVSLPRLENLELHFVDFGSEEACEKLISRCPILQYLDIHFLDEPDNEELRTPLSVFTCHSLQSLKLKGNIYVPVATLFCFPRLEYLKLHRVHFGSEEACEKLIRGCPMLQVLDLNIHFKNNRDYDTDDDSDDTDDDSDDDSDDDNDDFTCIISSASLRRLDIDCRHRTRLKLMVSSLEYLRLRGSIFEISVEKSLSSLVQADFDFGTRFSQHDFPNNSIVEVVRAFDCAKVLTLSTDIMRALSCATISLSIEFKRLVKLVATGYCSSLQDVIQSSDNLEDLIIDQLICVHDHSKWSTPVEVPRCLSNSLKKVQLYGYSSMEDKREMIRYMLEHGSALEILEIYCYIKRGGKKLEFLQEICEFPRKSPTCKVQFYEWPSKRQLKPY